MLGVSEKIVGGALFDDLTFAHNENAVAKMADHIEIMRDKEIAWKQSLQWVSERPNYEIIKEGDYLNSRGLKGKILISRQEGHLCWRVFYHEGVWCYKIECWAIEENASQLTENIEAILDSFSPPDLSLCFGG